MSSTSKFANFNKVQLRAACKEAGVKNYGNLTNDGMRAALLALEPAPAAEVVNPVVEVVNPLIQDLIEDEVEPVNNVMGSMFGQMGVTPAVIVAAPTQVTRVVDGKKVTTSVKAPAPARESVRTGYTIEKEREERNGVKAPSHGTICAAIWAHFTANPANARANQLESIADTNQWDRTTVQVQFYVWRKFNGIKGRQA